MMLDEALARLDESRRSVARLVEERDALALVVRRLTRERDEAQAQIVRLTRVHAAAECICSEEETDNACAFLRLEMLR